MEYVNKEDKMKKISVLLLVCLLCLGLTACKSSETIDPLTWAIENGYVKASDYNLDPVDGITSATVTGEGGLNFGTVEWPEELKEKAVREYLKGDASPLFESGYNSRNMMQIATAYNNRPIIGSVEFALNDDFSFTAGSEKNTEKLNAMMINDSVALYWTRQFRDEDNMPSYFYSYGVEVQGRVVFYDWNSDGEELAQAIKDVRNYFKTMGMQYGKYFNESAEGYLDDQALVEKMQSSGTVYYKVVPDKIVITSPYMLFMMNNQGNIQIINTSTGKWEDYPFVSNELLAEMMKTVNAVYPTSPLMNGLQLSAMLKQMGVEAPADGLKTQATIYFN